MLVLDEVRKQRNAKGLAQEEYADRVASWIDEQLGSARLISDVEDSMSNPSRQMGHMLAGCSALEAELGRLSPRFVFQDAVPGKRMLSWLDDSGLLSKICVYEAGPTPEYSIMNARWEWECDPDFALGLRTLDRSDVRGEPVTLQEAWDLIKILGPAKAGSELMKRRADQGLNEASYRPGFKRVLKTWSEAVRGWRSVIARVLQTDVITLSQAEEAVKRLGGEGEGRSSWATQTGRRTDLVATM